MPFFLILPLWFLAVVVGILLLFFRRVRFLSSYILLGSTAGLIGSFFLSTAVLFIIPRLFDSPGMKDPGAFAGISMIGGYLAAIVLGGLMGILIGGLLAHQLNRIMGRRD